MEDQLALIQSNFDRADQMLMEQYDSHMKAIMPHPQLLPIRIDVQLVKADGTKIELPNILQVKPYETVDSLTAQIKDHFEARGDPITTFEPEKICLAGPLTDDDEDMTDGKDKAN